MTKHESFDYVVIGAGSAGSVVAGRLAEAQAGTVCVLEAGGHDRHLAIHVPAAVVYALGDPRIDWMFRTAPSEGTGDRSLVQSRGKVLGGSGAINGHVYTRGHRADFDGWAAEGNPGWSYAEFLPYFKRSERRIGPGDEAYRGRSGPFTITDMDAPDTLCEAFMAAAESIGHPAQPRLQRRRQDGIAYVQRRSTRDDASALHGHSSSPRCDGQCGCAHRRACTAILFEGKACDRCALSP